MAWGHKDELRNFSLTYPIAYLMCLDAVDRLYRPAPP
jgi:hypothetical protein